LRALGLFLAAALLVLCPLRLTTVVGQWRDAARISERLVKDVERQVTALPAGSLILLDAPPVFVAPSSAAGRAVGRPWLWAYAVPYAIRPPFTTKDLTNHAYIIVPQIAYCCDLWWVDGVRANVSGWLKQPRRSPVAVLQWDARARRLIISDRDRSSLQDQVVKLSQAKNALAMTQIMDSAFGR
jgi:hypothetical protein